jgi:hypothetical protein
VDNSPTATPAAAEPTPATGFVLLKPDARIWTAPRQDADHSELYPASPELHVDPLSAVKVARVVARSGPYVGIGTGDVPWDDAVCHRSVGRDAMFRGFDIVVWAREDDLQEVLTEPVEADFDTWGGYRLSPGLAVGPAARRGPSFRTVATQTMNITTEIPDSAVGLIYEPIPESVPATSKYLPARCDEGPCSISVRAQVRVELTANTSLSVVAPQDISDRHSLVALHTRCAVVTGHVLDEDIVQGEHGPRLGGSACGGYSLGIDFAIRPNAPVYFADGSRAGTTEDRRVPIHRRDRLDEAPEGHVCFRSHPTGAHICGAPDRYITLCFDPVDVSVLERKG